MDTATQQLKEDVWQVLAHAWANNLIFIAILFLVVGIALRLFLPRFKSGSGFIVCGVGLFIFAVLTHGVAWTTLL